MTYKEKLRYLRESKELTQQEVGAIIGVDRKAYSHFETEYTIIPIKHLITLCNCFNVSLDYIFNFNSLIQYSNINKNINVDISGTRLKELRKENKLTQEELANILKSDRSTLAKYEKGTNIISTSYLYEICRNFKVSADYLLGRIDEPKYLK